MRREDAYKAQSRVERLCENRVRGIQDKLRKEDLIIAFVYLEVVSLRCGATCWSACHEATHGVQA